MVTWENLRDAAIVGTPLTPEDLEDKVVLLRRTTRGKDITDSVGLI
jgi:hypothetical protein